MDELKSPASEVKPQENPLKAILQYAAVPLALVTSLLYLFGRVHYETYLSYWGLSESLFPLSKDQSVISGFVHSLRYSATMLPKMGLTMIGLVVAMIAVFVSTYRPFVESIVRLLLGIQSKAALVVRKNVAITPEHDKLMNGISLVAGGIGLFVLVLVTILLPWGWIADQAKENARKEHQNILAGKEDNKPFSSRATIVVNNPAKGFDQYSGHLIQTSATHAALYRKDTGVNIIPLATVARMVIHENRATVKK